jgi:hypothetical protein
VFSVLGRYYLKKKNTLISLTVFFENNIYLRLEKYQTFPKIKSSNSIIYGNEENIFSLTKSFSSTKHRKRRNFFFSKNILCRNK